ncbi:hypothetical protein INT47_011157 [Mucor saturninus]|uniref:Uncharacterized protein n=1 Tax=Mucor saturninus TaxID=64648 RepID=A0A8H7UN93_9FUNG|nr:hypothetical protein INT47_011157 [Mucor saturninus]
MSSLSNCLICDDSRFPSSPNWDRLPNWKSLNSASSSSFGHDPLVAEEKSLKHEVMEIKNTITELKEMIKDMAGHSRFAGMSGFTDQEGNTELRNMLSNIYTEEKKKAILQNPNCLGQRVEVKPSGLSAKNELIVASKIYYFKSHNNVLQGGPVEMDDCELERRYDLTYTAMKNFVTVYILPQFTLYPDFTWMKIGFKKRELLALISEDHMFSYLGADNCLPLFAFTKSGVLKTFWLLQSETVEIKAPAQKTREREFALEQAKLRRSSTSSKNNKGPAAKKLRK